jgi:hypothetical protein
VLGRRAVLGRGGLVAVVLVAFPRPRTRVDLIKKLKRSQVQYTDVSIKLTTDKILLSFFPNLFLSF